MPRLRFADNAWSGIDEAIRSYGFGPVAPNTVLFGIPENGNTAALAHAIRTAVREHRNVMLVGDAPETVGNGYLDIWWRGGGDNGALMLALAILLRRDEDWRRLELRVNMMIQNRTAAEAKKQLSDFLTQARIKAETRIIDMQGSPFTQVLANSSHDAGLTLVGLRTPQNNETDESYGEYLGRLVADLASVPSPVFVLAANELELTRIFS